MSRPSAFVLLAAGVLAAAGPARALAREPDAGPSTQAPVKESGSPIADQGSNFDYRSYISSISPGTPGLDVEVLAFADRLLLRNHTGRTVTIYGYSGEPYARVLADGTAEQNVRSPAVYLNTNFYADVTVPPSASTGATPKWVVVDRTGQFEWHDHRIHWMSPVTPPQVKDKGRRTKIFDWSVPIAVGAQRGAVSGQLFWVPESSKAPTGAIVTLVLIVAASIAFVLFVRRRRARDVAPVAVAPGGEAEGAEDRASGGDGGRGAW
jgi:hypothetical protein